MTVTTTEKVRLYGWIDDFAEGARPIRAILFGEMVRRATPIMEHFQSDLFHDAIWINENVNGVTAFDWLIRPSGTNLSANPDPTLNDARIGVKIGAGEGAAFYRIELISEDGYWSALFTNVPLDEIRGAK